MVQDIICDAVQKQCFLRTLSQYGPLAILKRPTAEGKKLFLWREFPVMSGGVFYPLASSLISWVGPAASRARWTCGEMHEDTSGDAPSEEAVLLEPWQPLLFGVTPGCCIVLLRPSTNPISSVLSVCYYPEGKVFTPFAPCLIFYIDCR